MNKERPLKPQRVEPLVKEEGEMSDDEEVYEKFKEEKWMEWCEEMMTSEIKTLNRLHRLQTTSANLPKEKVRLSFASSFFFVRFIFLIIHMLILLFSYFICRCFQKFEIIYSFLDEG